MLRILTFLTTTMAKADKEKHKGRSNILLRSAILSSLVHIAVCSTGACFYEILGVEKAATQQQIKKAYRRKALQSHPDKNNGDRKEYDAIREAYDCLSDDDKRRVYDRHGKDGLDDPGSGMNGFGGGTNSADLFRAFFGSGGRGGPSNSAGPRHRNMRYQLEVTLEDLYNGLDRDITIAQPASNKKVHVHIDRGSNDGQSVILSGEVDYLPNAVPGDVIFILAQRSHGVFTRKGNDLAMRMNVDFHEAMMGFNRTITHLDERQVTLALDEDDVSENPITKGCVRVVKECGMPVRGRPGKYGDLFVEFDVRLPTNLAALNEEEREQLGALLKKATGVNARKKSENGSDESCEILKLVAGRASDFGKNFEPTFDHDEHMNMEEENDDPFGAFGGRGSGFRSFTYNSVGGESSGETQCQQM